MTLLRRLLGWLATGLSFVVTRWRRRRVTRGLVDDPTVAPYAGWGTAWVLHVRARVLSDHRAVEGSMTDPWWRNALRIVRRFVTSEVPGAIVRVTADGTTRTAVTDDEGYVALTLPRSSDGVTGWIDVHWELEEPIAAGSRAGHRTAPEPCASRAFVPPPSARFGVVSDLDDTVLRTGITSRLTMISTTFFNNARTRLPFPGVAEFYRALHADGTNPFFYVSTSPWNLYDLLEDFLRIREVPPGPMFLTDWGLNRRTFIQPDTHAHKAGSIQTVLDAYPDLPFVLIGDAGQHDPEIYRDVVLANPGRIAVVYIRTLGVPGRRTALDAIRVQLAAVDVPFLFGPETLGAAVHAADTGLIDPGTVDEVRAAVRS